MLIKLCWRIGSAITLAITALAFTGYWASPIFAQTKPLQSGGQPFIGTWTAVHAGTPIFVLHLRSEKSELVGDIQVCSFSVNATGTVDVVTDSTLSKNLPIYNIQVSDRLMSFDWKDPDGDNVHLKLEMTGKDSGRIVWVGLPSDVNFQPIPVSKKIPKRPESLSNRSPLPAR